PSPTHISPLSLHDALPIYWINCLKNNNVKISMDGKGRALDNIFIERFWRSIKYDYIYISPANDGLELYQGINTFIDEYNSRKHQGINRAKPLDLYVERKSKLKSA